MTTHRSGGEHAAITDLLDTETPGHRRQRTPLLGGTRLMLLGLALILVGAVVTAVSVAVLAGSGKAAHTDTSLSTASACARFDAAVAIAAPHLSAARTGDPAAVLALGQTSAALRPLATGRLADPDLRQALLAAFGAYTNLANLAGQDRVGRQALSDAEVSRADAVEAVIARCEDATPTATTR